MYSLQLVWTLPWITNLGRIFYSLTHLLHPVCPGTYGSLHAVMHVCVGQSSIRVHWTWLGESFFAPVPLLATLALCIMLICSGITN